MIVTCPDCGSSQDWSLGRVGNQPVMMSNCRHCNPTGLWYQEPIEVIWKPRGKAGIWPAPTDVAIAQVDDETVDV